MSEKPPIKVLIILTWPGKDRSYRSRLSSWLSYAPTTLGSLCAIVKGVRPKWQVDTLDEMSDKIIFDAGSYDIVMISATTPAVKRGYEIADEFRKRGSYICMGGYHVSYNHEEALAHADTVIAGPGEYALKSFIEDFEAGHPERFYSIPDVRGEDIPAPDRSAIKLKHYYKWPAVTANNGCMNHCTYCLISEMWRCSSPRPVENVINEIKALRKRIIIFYDPNFFGNRSYSIELMKELKKLKIRWAGSATISIGFDEELLKLAKESGCAGLLFGLESMNKKALDATGKLFNDPKDYRQAIVNIQRHGIMVNGCFILGMDGDSEEELMSLPDQVDYLGLNLARFAVLTPVPGSELYKELETKGRIIDRDWDHYTQHCVVFKPSGMSPERLEEIYRYVWKETYRMKNIIRRIRRVENAGIISRITCFTANMGFKYLGIS
ncbi:MAG: radical SAM protein [Lachnospiraceae bacterium]|nr:radical SAM protein [Lachnospiraceae bacterium]